jgi:hypothetical protein
MNIEWHSFSWRTTNTSYQLRRSKPRAKAPPRSIRRLVAAIRDLPTPVVYTARIALCNSFRAVRIELEVAVALSTRVSPGFAGYSAEYRVLLGGFPW